MYARKWLNRFMLQLVTMKEVAETSAEQDVKTNRAAAGQKLVMEETRKLIAKYLETERTALEYNHTYADEIIHAKFSDLMKELLNGFCDLDAFHLYSMQWITPVLLGAISCKKDEILSLTQKLVTRVSTPPQSECQMGGAAKISKDGILAIPQPVESSDEPLGSHSVEVGLEPGEATKDDDAPQNPEKVETAMNSEEDETPQIPKEAEIAMNLEKDDSPSEPEKCNDNPISPKSMEVEQKKPGIFESQDLKERSPMPEKVDPPEVTTCNVNDELGLQSSGRTESAGSLIKEAEV